MQFNAAIPICCKARHELAQQFAIAARLYSEAVVLLTRESPAMSSEKYEQLRNAAEKAQRDAEAMGIAFEEHVDSHRCSAQPIETAAGSNGLG
jgi:hypothetical protein